MSKSHLMELFREIEMDLQTECLTMLSHNLSGEQMGVLLSEIAWERVKINELREELGC